MAAEPTQKFSVFTLTAMVVGSMVGAGIFSLPQTFGRATGVLGALIAWAIAGGGMLMLAFVFQTLARRKPELDAGVYAYAKAGFGEYPGFLSALGYWTVCCLGNVSYFVLIKSTLGALMPVFGDGNTVQAVAVSSVILWTVHFLILRGVKEAASLNRVATVAKIIPIILFVVIVAAAFKPDVFAANLSGGTGAQTPSLFAQVRGTMLVTVFVFVGIEGASVYSRYARRREDVGLATLLGFLGVLALMVLVTILSYGVLPREELGALRNPSMAGVLQAVVGPWGAVFVSAGLIVSVMGAYLSWSLLAAEVLFSAAKMGSMPAFLTRENARAVPAAALWLTNALVQSFLIITLFAEQAFLLALKLTSSMILIPYLLVAAYALKLAMTGESYRPAARERLEHVPQKLEDFCDENMLQRIESRALSYRSDDSIRADRALGDLVRAGLATLYALGLIYAGGLKFLLLSAVIYAPGTLLYVITRREQGRRVFAVVEVAMFAVAVSGALAAAYGLATGRISV